MGAWQDIREAQEENRQSLWGTTLTFNGVEFPCTATSPEQTGQMERTAIMPTKPVVFTVLNADYDTLRAMGLGLRSIIESNGDSFQVYALNNDPADSTADLRCVFNVSSRK